MSKGKPTRRRSQAAADREVAAQDLRAFHRQAEARAQHARRQRAKVEAAEDARPVDPADVEPDVEVDGRPVGPRVYTVDPGQTLRNPRRAAKLRKSGRLRRDLDIDQ